MNTDAWPALPATSWRKSRHSTATGNCVEVAHTATATGIRDSKHPTGGHLALTTAQWADFLTTVKQQRVTA